MALRARASPARAIKVGSERVQPDVRARVASRVALLGDGNHLSEQSQRMLRLQEDTGGTVEAPELLQELQLLQELLLLHN